jgi:hypothetical protein
MIGRLLTRTMKYFPVGKVVWGSVTLHFAIHPYHMAFGGFDPRSSHWGYFLGPMGFLVKKGLDG